MHGNDIIPIARCQSIRTSWINRSEWDVFLNTFGDWFRCVFLEENQSICFSKESQKFFCEECVLANFMCHYHVVTVADIDTESLCTVCKLLLIINTGNHKAGSPLQSEWNRINQHKTKIVYILSKKNLIRLPHLGHWSFSAPASISKLGLFVSGAWWFSD